MDTLNQLAKMDFSFEELQILCRALRIYKTRLESLDEEVHRLYGNKGAETFKIHIGLIAQLISRADRTRASIEP